MTIHQVKVRVDLNAHLGGLLRSLQETIDYVSVGIMAVPGLSGEDVRLPGAIFQFYPVRSDQRRSLDQVKSEYPIWALRHGFRDQIEIISHYLEETRTACALYSLNMLNEVRGKDWNTVILKGREKFNWKKFPEKLDFLEQKYGIILNLAEEVKSINKARNCLVHRRGIVSQADANDGNRLTVMWRGLEITATGAQGERNVIPGKTIVEGGEILQLGFVSGSKSFAHGESVSFSASEFSEISLTLYLFGEDLAKKVEEYGRKCGIKFREPG